MDKFLYVVTDPVVMMEAIAAIYDMGRVKIISALLLQGPPGVGKSYLGLYLQHLLGAQLLRYQMVFGTTRDDILFDREILTPDGRPTDGVIIQAMNLSQSAKVVLILEELDKAASDVDALLLTFFQEGEMWFPQLGTVKANQENLLVVITKNDEREASSPLLRRCRVAEMTWPGIEAEVEILQAYHPFLTAKEAAEFLELPRLMRTWPSLRKPPSIHEIVRLLGDLLLFLPRTDDLNLGRYCLQSLTVFKDDRILLANTCSALYLGTKMREMLTPLLPRFEEIKLLVNLPIPSGAAITEQKSRRLS
jgi:MoxR-like ATPase